MLQIVPDVPANRLARIYGNQNLDEVNRVFFG